MKTRRNKTSASAAIDRVMAMMAIPGGSTQEGKVMRFIIDELRRAGLPRSAIKFDNASKLSPRGGETGNLVVKLPGVGEAMARQPRRLLMAHVDTVPICVGSKPVRRGKWVRSGDPARAIGADNRSGAAAILTAALNLLRNKLPHPPVTFLWPVQEEIGLLGARYASLEMLGDPQLAFNWDGGPSSRMNLGATGAYRMMIDIHGVASHAGVRPEMGVSSITIAGKAIASLEKQGYLGLIRKGRKTGTSNVGQIEGGEALNVVAPHTRLRAEVRSHDPRFRKLVMEKFVREFVVAAKRTRSATGQCGEVEIEVGLDYESFALDKSQPSVLTARAAVLAVTRREPDMVLSNGGFDANWLTARGIPTITLGAGQHGAHTVDECLNITEYLQACDIATMLATAGEPTA